MVQYNYLNQPVLATLDIALKDDDSFYFPALLAHTGFAADGFQYQAGVQDPSTVATWASELPSATRGPLGSFPTSALVLLNRASLIIFDTSNGILSLWMLFLFGDQLAFPNNYSEETYSYTASEMCWACGRLTVALEADGGSYGAPVTALTVDFALDQVYIDAPQPPA